MNSDAHLEELGEFLRARRAQLNPQTVGLPDMGTLRRVQGLRREEVAQLAAISTDYYTRLEQGRVPASAPVLDTLARVLRLDDDQRAYLYKLSGKRVKRSRKPTPQKVRFQMQRLLDHLADIPAMVQDQRFDILAWNPMAAALLVDFSKIPEQQRNYVRLLFTHPTIKQLYDDWESVARFGVSLLRMKAAHDPEDARLTALVGELSMQSQQFREWWAAHYVASKSSGTRVFHHPMAGVLSLDWDILVSTSDRSQELVVWTAEPGSPSFEGLRRLKEP
ncbi:XRE family transcriptional regulator [bacterium]|nr:MAG: XRE family transcriptional regulator [bacterium]